MTPSAGASLRDRSFKLQSRLYYRLAPRQSRGMPTEPDIEIATRAHGEGPGAYVVATEGLSADSVVYSFGIGSDASFDLSLIESHRLTVHAFDPTEQSARFLAEQSLPERFHFHRWALSDSDGESEFRQLGASSSSHYLPGTVLDTGATTHRRDPVPALTLETIMERLGHDHVDVLKLDIEGGEYRVLDAFGETAIPATQIVLELHPHLANLESHSLMIGRRGWQRTLATIERLRAGGYELFHVSERGTELSFLRR